MYCANIDENIRLYYKAHNSESGRTDCVIDVFKDSGDHIVVEEVAQELGNGIYYIDIGSFSSFCYLLVRGWTQEYPNRKAYDVVKVGNSDYDKIFYRSKHYQTSLVIPYQIYNLDYDLLQNGNLDEFGHGFYFLEIQDKGKYFIKIEEQQKLIEIPLCALKAGPVPSGGGGLVHEIEEVDKCQKYKIRVIGLSTKKKELSEAQIKILNLELRDKL